MVTKQRRTTTPARPRSPAAPRTLPLRSWHVITENGADHTVVAQDLDLHDGILTFSNGPAPWPVVVRAFGPNAWHDVELVPLPADTPATN